MFERAAASAKERALAAGVDADATNKYNQLLKDFVVEELKTMGFMRTFKQRAKIQIPGYEMNFKRALVYSTERQSVSMARYSFITKAMPKLAALQDDKVLHEYATKWYKAMLSEHDALDGVIKHARAVTFLF